MKPLWNKWCLTEKNINTVFVPSEHPLLKELEKDVTWDVVWKKSEIDGEDFVSFTFMADDLFSNLCKKITDKE